VPVYASREDLKNRPESESWVDIDDVEFFALGNSPRLAEGEEPPALDYPDPITDPEGSLHGAHDIANARRVIPTTPRERLVVLNGEAVFESENGRVTLRKMQWVDVPASGGIIRNNLHPGPEGHRGAVEVARIAGHWKQAIRTAIFNFGPGRPCDYHYHDGDEYWFVFRGHFTLHYRGEDVEFRPGMILAAGMGEEHGVVRPDEVFEGIGFATQLEGEGRDGHLWRPVHGEPVAVRGG
jgi:mannose-6-phosphate isomerase-like protein (cupin superfamily)